jgi:hypothetical protein
MTIGWLMRYLPAGSVHVAPVPWAERQVMNVCSDGGRGASNVICAVPVVKPSAWLVAVMAAVLLPGSGAGAEYWTVFDVAPVSVPDPLRDHVTAVLVLPTTFAVICCAWPAVSVIAGGVTPTEIPVVETVRKGAAWCVSEPLWPVTPRVYVPAAAPAEVYTVREVEWPAAMYDDPKLAVTPGGRLRGGRYMVPEKPLKLVVPMV